MKKYLLFLFALLTTATVWAQTFIPLQMGENNGIELGPNDSGKGYLSFTPEETDYYVFSTDADVSHYICINLWSDSYYDAYSQSNGPGYVPGEYTCDLGYLNKLNAGQTYLLRIAPQDDSLTGLAQVTVRKGYLVSPDAESADLTTMLSRLPMVAYEGQEVKLTVVSGTTINSLTATTVNGDPIALTVDDTGRVYSFTMPAADVTISGSGEIASLQLGDNEIDLTGEGTQFTFTPAESGAYVFLFTPGNVDDREPLKIERFTEELYGKLVGDRGYISKDLFCKLFINGIQLITKLKNKMKNSLMSVSDKVLLRKRAIIESVNDELKNMAQIEHSRHRSFHNFVNNLMGGIAAYCFFPKKPMLQLEREFDNQLTLF